MIVSRKVVSATTVAYLAAVVAWALHRYAGIDLDTEQSLAAAALLVGLAGYATREDARVAGELQFKGRHRGNVTVADLAAQREQDDEDDTGPIPIPAARR